MTIAAGVPKTIYSVWFQGLEAAPDLVRFNYERWSALNPDYRVTVLDRRDVLELLEEVGFPMRDMPMQALSDVVRTLLLRDNGGVWVDLTVLPLQPLSHWLDDALTEAGFFAPARPAPDRPIASWFMAAIPDNLIFRQLWKEIERFWAQPRRLLIGGTPADPVGSVSPHTANANEFPYHWFHYLFHYLLNSDTEYAEIWNTCSKLGVGEVPMHKLDWRIGCPVDVLADLLDEATWAIAGHPAQIINLLLAEVARRPDDARLVLHVAQTYYYIGDFVNARRFHTRRAEIGGTAEEDYYALVKVAELTEVLGDRWPDVQAAYLRAWGVRPTRAEPLHAIARRYREERRYELGYLFAKGAADIPLPEGDEIAVSADVYAWRAADEQAVCASWIGKHAEAFTLWRHLLARGDLPDSDRQRIAANRDVCVPTMLEAASSYPDELVQSLLLRPDETEVALTLIAGPDLTRIEHSLNSILSCCTDISRVGRFLVLDAGLSENDRASLQQRYRFLDISPPGTTLAQIRDNNHERFWLHLGEGWRFFAPENLITRLIAVLHAEPHVVQVGINLHDATDLTGASAPEHTVRRAPDTGRYLLTEQHAHGPAMLDTTRPHHQHTATLDEVLCINPS